SFGQIRKTFLNLELKVHSAIIDHADAIASAFELVWPHIEILSCWEHFLRQSRKQTKLEKTKGFMEDIGEQHLRLLHQSRSLKQFRALSKRVVKAWKESGEDKLAEWLQNVYLTKRWERWSVNSSSVPGFLPSQQPIESHHRVIKVIVTDYKKAPTITVLNSVLPRVLLYDATNLTPEHHRHYAEGPLPINAVVKAKKQLLLPGNYASLGWVCSHVIASLDLLNKLKIGLALQKIPMRGLPGRRRDFQGGLTRDSDPYDVDRLIQLFTKTPGKPLKWPVVQEFDIEDEGHTRSIELVKLQDADCLRQKECTCGALSSSMEICWNIKSRNWSMQFGALMH
ncbi:hypothetical protein F443_01379, partial [Phytophthora nicotianae P1569]